ELDQDLIAPLSARFATQPNFRLLAADALKVDFTREAAPTAGAPRGRAAPQVDFCRGAPPAPTARVVANLPYYVSTPILQRLIAQRHCLNDMTLMLQREVVDRMLSGPGSKDYGFLSVLVQFYCEG